MGSVDGEKRLAGTSGGERKSAVVTSAVATSENALTTKTRTGSGGVDLAFLVVDMIKMVGITSFKVVTRKRPWRLIVQMFIEKVYLFSNHLSCYIYIHGLKQKLFYLFI